MGLVFLAAMLTVGVDRDAILAFIFCWWVARIVRLIARVARPERAAAKQARESAVRLDRLTQSRRAIRRAGLTAAVSASPSGQASGD